MMPSIGTPSESTFAGYFQELEGFIRELEIFVCKNRAHGKAGLGHRHGHGHGHRHGYLRMHDGGTRLLPVLDVPILPLLM